MPADNKKKGGLFGGMSSMPGATPEMSEEQALRAVRDLVELEKVRCLDENGMGIASSLIHPL